MACLPHQHRSLAAMVSVVSDEVSDKSPQIGLETFPTAGACEGGLNSGIEGGATLRESLGCLPRATRLQSTAAKSCSL